MSVAVRDVVLSRFALDGGAMHGIIPRILWERTHAADAQHRIALVARAIVVEDDRAGSRALIELGLGPAWTEKERGRYGIAPSGDVPTELAAAGIAPETITHVLLTHLHWDHAGGIVTTDGEVAFSGAEVIVSARAAAHARAPSAKDDGSFRHDLLDVLFRHPRLRLVEPADLDGRVELAPHVTARISEGHTPGLMVPLVIGRNDGPPIAFPTDLVPTRSHCRAAWVAAYDIMPATSAKEKQELFEHLAGIGGGIVFYHDPAVAAGWARRDKYGAVEVEFGRLDGTVENPA